MKEINLKQFQEKPVADLRNHFLELWNPTNRKLPLIFKVPTGSGKTVMVAQFLKDISSVPQFDVDKDFLWFSFTVESYVQSKNKLFNYYGNANELNLIDLNDLIKGKLEKNNIFFINWQKIKSSTKEGRVIKTTSKYLTSLHRLAKICFANFVYHETSVQFPVLVGKIGNEM